MVGGQDRDEVALVLDAALGPEALDLVAAALHHGPVTRLDGRRTVIQRAVLGARGVLGAASGLGLDVVARVRRGERGQGKKAEETEASHLGRRGRTQR